MDESAKSQLEVIQSELTETKDKVTDTLHSVKRIERTISHHQIGTVGFGGMCAGMALAASSKFILEGVVIFFIGAILYIVSLFLSRGK